MNKVGRVSSLVTSFAYIRGISITEAEYQNSRGIQYMYLVLGETTSTSNT